MNLAKVIGAVLFDIKGGERCNWLGQRLPREQWKGDDFSTYDRIMGTTIGQAGAEIYQAKSYAEAVAARNNACERARQAGDNNAVAVIEELFNRKWQS